MTDEFFQSFRRHSDDPVVKVVSELSATYVSNRVPQQLKRKRSWKNIGHALLRKKIDREAPQVLGFDEELLMYVFIFLSTPRVDIQIPVGKHSRRENYVAFKGILELFSCNDSQKKRTGLELTKVDYTDDKLEIHASVRSGGMDENRNVYF